MSKLVVDKLSEQTGTAFLVFAISIVAGQLLMPKLPLVEQLSQRGRFKGPKMFADMVLRRYDVL